MAWRTPTLTLTLTWKMSLALTPMIISDGLQDGELEDGDWHGGEANEGEETGYGDGMLSDDEYDQGIYSSR